MPVVTEKLCRECNQLLPASAFGVVLSAKDWLKPYCKPCESKRHNAWVDSSEERVEKRKRDSKQWREANPERFKATQRAWMERNWDRVLEYTNANSRRYRELYPERYVKPENGSQRLGRVLPTSANVTPQNSLQRRPGLI